MNAVVKKKKPLLSQKHRKERMGFAIRHKDWTLEDWKRMVWSDETKVNHLGSDGRKCTWKRAGEGLSDRLVEGIVKFGGGSVMLWGCMLWDGPGYACRIDGRMDGDLFIQILRLVPLFQPSQRLGQCFPHSFEMTPVFFHSSQIRSN